MYCVNDGTLFPLCVIVVFILNIIFYSRIKIYKSQINGRTGGNVPSLYESDGLAHVLCKRWDAVFVMCHPCFILCFFLIPYFIHA